MFIYSRCHITALPLPSEAKKQAVPQPQPSKALTSAEKSHKTTTHLPVKHLRREYEAPPPQVLEQSLQLPQASQLLSFSSSECMFLEV